VPAWDILDECRASGIRTIGTATTVAEAIALDEAGVDAIAASGFEGGGHRGSFLQRAEDSLVGTMALVPQIVDEVRAPVIAAGGIGDARGVLAALALGAEGVQLGTAFLTAEDSGASQLHREALRGPAAGQTGLTRGFTGRLARGLQNQLMDELNRPGTPYLPYPLQRALMKHLAVPADAAGRAELVPLWAGQAARLSNNPDATEFLQHLVREVESLAGAVSTWSAAHRKAR
jgi:nitronate monooxygenase